MKSWNSPIPENRCTCKFIFQKSFLQKLGLHKKCPKKSRKCLLILKHLKKKTICHLQNKSTHNPKSYQFMITNPQKNAEKAIPGKSIHAKISLLNETASTPKALPWRFFSLSVKFLSNGKLDAVLYNLFKETWWYMASWAIKFGLSSLRFVVLLKGLNMLAYLLTR